MLSKCSLLALVALAAPASALLRLGELTIRKDAPESPCAPTEAQLASLQPPKKLPKSASGVKFFLHEEGGFDFSDRVECYMGALGLDWDMEDLDKVTMPNIAEHTVDIWVLRQLRKHPARVHDPADADIHIIGSEVGASMHAGALAGDPCGPMREHYHRMEKLQRELEANEEFQRDGGRNWLLVNTDWQWFKEIIYGDFLELFRSSHMMLGAVDCNISAKGDIAPEDTIVMPYKAHTLLDQLDQPLESFLKHPAFRRFSFTFHGDKDRDYSYVFHGNMGRRHSGSLRGVVQDITEGLEAVSVESRTFKGSDPAVFANITYTTAHIMQDSTFCLIPAGDTASSRRLFDALAAGCVPIILNSFEAAASNLPFTNSIDWTKIAYFAGSLECLRDNVEPAMLWLKTLWLERGQEEVRQKQLLGRQTFLDVLSYKHGDLASAMLTEVGLARSA